MDLKSKIKALLQEAELYRGQGLLDEARDCYVNAGKLVKKNQNIIKNKKILASIARRITDIKNEIEKIENAPAVMTMPENVQNIIKEKFAFSKDKHKSALEGAIALAKFGQFERALKEFRDLIQVEPIRLEAAKNIIRCHKVLETIDEAVKCYHEWFSGKLFSADQLSKLRIFLQDILNKKGIQETLPEPASGDEERPEEMETGTEEVSEVLPDALELENEIPEIQEVGEVEDEEEEGEDIPAEELLDISSVEIVLDEGASERQTIELDVCFQSGNVINLLISSDDTDLLDMLKTGVKLKKLKFYSPIAMFTGKGVVSSASQISSGPKQGDYSLDIKIKSIT